VAAEEEEIPLEIEKPRLMLRRSPRSLCWMTSAWRGKRAGAAGAVYRGNDAGRR